MKGGLTFQERKQQKKKRKKSGEHKITAGQQGGDEDKVRFVICSFETLQHVHEVRSSVKVGRYPH